MRTQPYAEKVMIITGASAGIGRELALQAAAQGARLVLAARDAARLEILASECRAAGGEAIAVPTDVSDREACGALIQHTLEKFGRIDVLINNAGYGMTADIGDLRDITLVDRLMQVNFNGSVYCTWFALPHLKESRGRIIVMASVAGHFSMGGSAAYNASKFAMRGFFDALRQELAASGVSVTIICPGYVASEFAARVQGGDGRERGPRALGIYSPKIMSAATCARITLAAAASRKREVLMTMQAKIGRWLRLLAPGLMERILIRYRAARDRRMRELLTGKGESPHD